VTEQPHFVPPNQPGPTNQFGTPIPPGQQVPVNQFGTPIPGGAFTSFPPPPVAANPMFVGYGPPARAARPRWVLPVGGVAAVLVLVVATYAVFSSLRPSSAAPPVTAPTIDLGRLAAPPPGLPAALSAPAPVGSGSVVTQASARAVTLATWQLRNEALGSANLTLLGQIETGAALTGDRERASCGCVLHPEPGASPTIVVSAPRQGGYPATFMAQVSVATLGSAPYTRVILGFERASASTPWRVAFDTSAAYQLPPSVVAPKVQDGLATAVPASDVSLVRQLAVDLARQWQVAKDSGAPPARLGPFEPGAWTDQKDAALAAHRNGEVQANGLPERYAFTTDPRDPVYLAYESGRILGCTLIHRQLVVRAPAGDRIEQDARRLNWGGDLAPGGYQELDLDGLAQTCFEIVDPWPAAPAAVVGGDEADESVVVHSR
jgi:hypothetical protein